MRHLSEWALFVRLAAAAVAGIALGLDRELRGHPAGVRTHALVALGAALFTAAGAYGFADMSRGPNVDPARVAAQVASGVGFLGAGAILRQGLGVRGLTTAATLWGAAALGVAAGAGAYQAVWLGAGILLVVLIAMRLAKPAILRFSVPTSVIEVAYERGHGTLGPVLRSLAEAGGEVDDLQVTDDGDDLSSPGLRQVSIRVSTRQLGKVRSVAEVLRARPEVHSVRVEIPADTTDAA